ncbi:HPr family phosphocarrier protein [Kineothrix sp. MB12-C1]|uniref:HPr family phosphocarrier protein n=1 Tax=Kineothrix sp. MB12-C1 TaxID=3070215 RepID=UPI0027D2CF4E|nr:HPr family phosphocarrier protein [Kineothrix sp. MB12-C1]WMC92624.1 HPr family phosphocarrier protein [Kineothrix sp. MB12-C1]
MKEFKYTIKDELGIHARPAGLLVKVAAPFKSTITVDTGAKQADAKKIMAIMGAGAKKGMTVTCRADGPDEAEAIDALKKFFEANL